MENMDKQIALNTAKWLLELLKKINFPLSECHMGLNAQNMLTNIVMGLVGESQTIEPKNEE